MKKILVKVLLGLFFVFFSVVIFSSFAKNAEALTYKYFNPNIPYPDDPCDTGGVSGCYANQQ